MHTIPGRKTSLHCHSQSPIGVNSGPRIFFLLRTGTINLPTFVSSSVSYWYGKQVALPKRHWAKRWRDWIGLVEFFCFFAPVSLVFRLFPLVLLLAEIVSWLLLLCRRGDERLYFVKKPRLKRWSVVCGETQGKNRDWCIDKDEESVVERTLIVCARFVNALTRAWCVKIVANQL